MDFKNDLSSEDFGSSNISFGAPSSKIFPSDINSTLSDTSLGLFTLAVCSPYLITVLVVWLLARQIGRAHV